MDKRELLEKVRVEASRVDAALAGWDAGQTTQPNTVGEWSVKDVLVHIAGWEWWLVDLLGIAARGETPDFPTFDLTHDDVQRFNDRIVAERVDVSWEQELTHHREALAAMLAALEDMPEATLMEAGQLAWAGESALWRMVAACTYRHYREHLKHFSQARPPARKTGLLDTIREGSGYLEAALANLDEARATQPSVLGAWSVKDMVAHLTGWEQELLRWLQVFSRGESPDLPLSGGSWDWQAIDRANDEFVARCRDHSWQRVLADHRLSVEAVLKAVGAMPGNALFDPQQTAVWQDRPLSELILACTYGHYIGHLVQLAQWGENGLER